jgi:hypothetical protein
VIIKTSNEEKSNNLHFKLCKQTHRTGRPIKSITITYKKEEIHKMDGTYLNNGSLSHPIHKRKSSEQKLDIFDPTSESNT